MSRPARSGRLSVLSAAFRQSAALLAMLVVGGCGDATGPEDGQAIVRFVAVSGTGGGGDSTQDLPIDGPNGTLVIDAAWFVVDEFELEGDDDHGGCGDDREDGEECEFELGPIFLELPLDGDPTAAVRFEPTPGTYDELEFEVDRLDDDSGRELALLQDIRATFPDWPRDASLRVTGRFLPTDGPARPFTAYVDAEIQVELRLSPPVVIDADGADITVETDPGLWFTRSDGSVIDLSRYDWATTGQLLELRVEIESGFRRARHDD